MAETDITTKNQALQPQAATSGGVKAAKNGVEERVIRIQVIGGVANGDYPSSDFQTAKRTWEAFVEAGIEPQFLVANGLHEGHNYQVSEVSTRQLLKKGGVINLIGESRATEEALLAYNYTKSQAQADNNLISGTDKKTALVKVSQELGKFDEAGEIVEATVILPEKQQKIAEPNSN
ncbi:hypothetical protein HYW46_01235 [Candidatus Daviesbacteria bacterium]|nr:hypothetical protein [Candidatus Daviesbacteria bacterium]